MKILVTDGNQRAALAVTRSLGTKGIDVIVGESHNNSLSSASKYCKGEIIYPSPENRPPDFISYIVGYVKENKIDFLIPMTDVTVPLVLRNKKRLENYTKIPMPLFDAYDIISNKSKLFKMAEKLKVPIPKTIFIKDNKDVFKHLKEVRYPAVIKSFKSRILINGNCMKGSVSYADNETELLSLYNKKPSLKYPSLIQERIIGPGFGVFTLFNNGEPIVFFSHKRLRERPPSGGVSTLCESVPLDSNLKEYTTKLLKEVKWHGIAMAEYKFDERNNRYCLMEINGRFWGSLELAIKSGIDFPYLLIKLFSDGNVPKTNHYKIGVKNRWLLGDLDHLLLRLFKSNDLKLPINYPSRVHCILNFLNFFDTKTNYEVISLRDPIPFLRELKQYIKELFMNKN